MIAKLRSWWQKKRKPLGSIGIITACIAVVVLIFVVVRSYGTGFTGKTLWDWLQLLGVLAIPVAVALGTAWFTKKQGQVSEAENKDNQRETALQAYIDKMSELLLAQNLRNASEDEEGQKIARVRTLLDLRGVPIRSGPMEAQKIARVRTLTVLRRLDAERKGSVLLFLHESGLIDKDKRIIDLSGADLSFAKLVHASLSEANLSFAKLGHADLSRAWLLNAKLGQANLSGATLSDATLSGANLSEANLSGANLSTANLINADLREANLNHADLRNASVTSKQLGNARSLKDTIMPDGSKHP